MKLFALLTLFILQLSASERIVSLSPSITEILYALGVGDEIVATSSYSLYPKEAQRLPNIGGYSHPNLEKIISHQPSLVVGQSFNTTTLQKLHSFKVHTLQLKLKTIQNIQDSITLLGKTVHAQERAEKLNEAIQRSIRSITKSAKPHSVMIVYGLKEKLRSGVYIAGKDIFFDDIIRLSANTNAYRANSTKQPVLGYENIIALNPQQIIILHSHATEPNIDVQKALQNWYRVPTRASHNRNITVIDEPYLHIPSQRVALTIQRVAQEIGSFH